MSEIKIDKGVPVPAKSGEREVVERALRQAFRAGWWRRGKESALGVSVDVRNAREDADIPQIAEACVRALRTEDTDGEALDRIIQACRSIRSRRTFGNQILSQFGVYVADWLQGNRVRLIRVLHTEGRS